MDANGPFAAAARAVTGAAVASALPAFGQRLSPAAPAPGTQPATDSAVPARHVRVDANSAVEQQRLHSQQQEIAALKARDREVRAHEQAHSAVAGAHGGGAKLTYTKGPNGVRYAVGGHVSIDLSEVPGDPRATLQKAQQVRRAALAPADPSPQDRRVAGRASQLEAQARVELLELRREASPRTAEAGVDAGEVVAEVNHQDSRPLGQLVDARA